MNERALEALSRSIPSIYQLFLVYDRVPMAYHCSSRVPILMARVQKVMHLFRQEPGGKPRCTLSSGF